MTDFDITRLIFSLNDEDEYEDVEITEQEWRHFLMEKNFKNQKKNSNMIHHNNHVCNKKAFGWDYNLVQIAYYESIAGDKFSLKPEMRKFINIKTINDSTVSNLCINQYLKYMSVLSRQLLSTIKHDFDPYLLSNDIDNGIWS